MAMSYDDLKSAVKTAYSKLFTTPNSENNKEFMATSTAFIAEINKREAASTDEEEAVRVAAAAAAKAKAEEEARRAADQARAEEEARVAADKAKAAQDALKKKQLITEITAAFKKFFEFCNSYSELPDTKSFLSKHAGKEVTSSYGSYDIEALQTKKNEIDSGGSVFIEFERMYKEITGSSYVGSLPRSVAQGLNL